MIFTGILSISVTNQSIEKQEAKAIQLFSAHGETI